MKDGSKSALNGNNHKKQRKKRNGTVAPIQPSSSSKSEPISTEKSSKHGPYKLVQNDQDILKNLDKEAIKQLSEIIEFRETWSSEKFLASLRFKETEVKLDELNDAFLYLKQVAEPIDEINKAIDAKSLSLDKLLQDQGSFDVVKGLRLSSTDYYSNGALSAVFRATKILLVSLLKMIKDPILNFIIHLVFQNYMNIEKINEVLLNRLAGYNIFEQEFQDMMTKDFNKQRKDIDELQERFNILDSTCKNLMESAKPDLEVIRRIDDLNSKIRQSRRSYGLIRKLNARINGLVKRIERSEDDIRSILSTTEKESSSLVNSSVKHAMGKEDKMAKRIQASLEKEMDKASYKSIKASDGSSKEEKEITEFFESDEIEEIEDSKDRNFMESNESGSSKDRLEKAMASSDSKD